jgi:putative ABC transport system permease protein
MLWKSPGLTAVAVLALALGVGANTAIFSVVNAVLLRPLPYKDPDRLVVLWGNNLKQGRGQLPVSFPNFLDWKNQNRVFEDMASYAYNQFVITGRQEPERVRGVFVSTGFFPVLGVRPSLGRTSRPEEEREYLAVLSHALWQRRFGSDPSIIGQVITLNGKGYTVIGVMPPDFQFPPRDPRFQPTGTGAELWVTLSSLFTPSPNLGDWIGSRSLRGNRVIGQLKPGVTIQQAQAEMDTIAGRLEQAYPDANAGVGVTLVPLHEQLVGHIRAALLVFLGAVGFVLLIACANVANLLLARTATREKEMALRAALGASRLRLVRQLLTESTLLALLGGALGLLLALWGVDLLVHLDTGNIPRANEIGIDGRVLSFTLAISLLTGMIFGLAPALQASKLNLNETLKEGGRSSAGSWRGRRVRGLLVVSEIALTLVLLIGAGLMIKSFRRLLETPPGFNPQNVLTMQIQVSSFQHSQPPQWVAFYRQVLERVAALPGVQSVGTCDSLPPRIFQRGNSFAIEGHPSPGPGQSPIAQLFTISPDYFRALNVPLLKGRYFTEADTAAAPGVAIINETIARRFFPNEDPVGRRLKLGNPESQSPRLTIVGVVGDVKYSGLDADTEAGLYIPYLQNPVPGMYLMVRTASYPLSLAAAVRGQVLAVDKDQPVANIKTMEQVLAESVAQRRLNTLLLGLFAAVALSLAMVGIYGVVSYSVSQRTHEIGIRMALGAQTGDVLRLVVRQGLQPVLIGMAIGLTGALALTRLLSSLLYGVSATDPATFVVISLLLTAVALLACYIPARRATKVDPMIALRYE